MVFVLQASCHQEAFFFAPDLHEARPAAKPARRLELFRLLQQGAGMSDRIADLTEKLRAFAAERDWDQFHTPKNLAMSLSVEAAELMEPFQWLTGEESAALSSAKLEAVKDEVGDVFYYLLRLCDKLGIDPVEAARDKLVKSAAKYPVERVRGKALKYDEYK
jgi:NTP pyrophosphatase (non-canonical NTP hydrolase)